MKLPFKIVAFDLETTDSDFNAGEIIQIGAVVLNEDLQIQQTFSNYLKPFTKYRNPEAMAVNKITEETLSVAPSKAGVLSEFEQFALHGTGKEHPILASWGTYFDVTFLRGEYQKLQRPYPFSYRCIDLKSIAIWELAKRGQSLSGGVSRFLEALGLTFEGNQHDGLDDIKNVVRILQKLT